MSVSVSEVFKDYVNTIEGFNKFHNEVLNMPRDEFSGLGLEKLQTLAGYLLLLQDQRDDDGLNFSKNGHNYKEIMYYIHRIYINKRYPQKRDLSFENDYLNFTDLDKRYNERDKGGEGYGRMFRHLMEFCTLFGLIKSISRNQKVVDFEKCKEYLLAKSDIELPLMRNNIIGINAKNNDFIKSLSSIDIDDKTDYRPAHAIISYIKEINRPVTKFELSILLGRIDILKTEKDILDRAICVGRLLPTTKSSQLEYFFREMGWVYQDGSLFRYSSSQQPWFKFNSFIQFMIQFGLLSCDEITDMLSLTEYAKEILSDDVSYIILDLEELLSKFDDDSIQEKELKDIIINRRKNDLLELLNSSEEFITKMGNRSLKNASKDSNNKKIRNDLIMAFAKLRVNDTCEAVWAVDSNGINTIQYNCKLYPTSEGRHYCEGHHIIEFNGEDGPDIIENVIVLDPNTHMLIHHANDETRRDFYQQLRENKVITFDRFEKMVAIYNCLSETHVQILYNKGIINRYERDNLLLMINQKKLGIA